MKVIATVKSFSPNHLHIEKNIKIQFSKRRFITTNKKEIAVLENPNNKDKWNLEYVPEKQETENIKLREKAKYLGISNWHIKGIARLKREIAEVENGDSSKS